MANDIFPAFVKINYHSSFAPHTMTIPTLAWINSGGGGGAGEFDTHAGGTVDADSMINDLVDELVALYPVTCTFDNYVIFSVPSLGARGNPVASKPLGTVGTNASTTWSKAVQVTMNWRTDAFNLFKLVSLDCISGGSFDKVNSISGGFLAAIDALVTSSVQGWAGRDNGQPSTFVSQTTDLNDALRRRYRMA